MVGPASQMATIAASLSVFAGPLAAETVQCTLAPICDDGGLCTGAPLDIAFEIDQRQFAPPVNAGDPPRRKITRVITSEAVFDAEPFVMDAGVRGFWGEDANSARMLVVSPEGVARYVEMATGATFTGTCEVGP